MPKSLAPRRPLTSRQRVERLSKRSPSDDAAPVAPMPLNDANGADDPTPAAIENDRGILDRYGWQP